MLIKPANCPGNDADGILYRSAVYGRAITIAE
jgi:hypothetical protein